MSALKGYDLGITSVRIDQKQIVITVIIVKQLTDSARILGKALVFVELGILE